MGNQGPLEAKRTSMSQTGEEKQKYVLITFREVHPTILMKIDPKAALSDDN